MRFDSLHISKNMKDVSKCLVYHKQDNEKIYKVTEVKHNMPNDRIELHVITHAIERNENP